MKGWTMPARLVATLAAMVVAVPAAGSSASPVARIDRVVDGDTVVLAGGQRVRLVQVDTPEVHSGSECYGREATAVTERLLPPGTSVRLFPEPATDRVDDYGRLLRYVVRVRGGLNVNVRLVKVGAAAPYFYRGRRGRYADELDRLALAARARKLGLWGRCPGTPYEPDRAVDTGPAR